MVSLIARAGSGVTRFLVLTRFTLFYEPH